MTRDYIALSAKGSIALEVDRAAGRLALGLPDRCVFDEVRVICNWYHGVTVFPVLKQDARKLGICLHCGEPM